MSTIAKELETIRARQAELCVLIHNVEKRVASVTLTVPAQRIELQPGEFYAGTVFGENGADYHLILLDGEKESTNWADATAWSKSLGGQLPDRRDLRLLWVNAKDKFSDSGYYWSCETYASYESYAWIQRFDGGNQYYGRKSGYYRARAVRRLPIQQFNNSCAVAA